MAPAEIEILMHYHYSTEPHPGKHTSYIQGKIESNVMDGILKESANGNYETTDRGKAFVHMLCATPFPTEAWVDQNGKVIELN